MKMKIELKKIKIFDELSEETIAFAAELYVNNVNVASAKNSGFGGETEYRTNGVDDVLLMQAEQHCLRLPEKTIEGTKITFKMNLTEFIDQLLDAHLKKREDRILHNNMKKGICSYTKTKRAYSISFWAGRTIIQMLNTPKGEETVRQTIIKLKKSGATIMNTNLPEGML